jgi:hypothetical protein
MQPLLSPHVEDNGSDIGPSLQQEKPEMGKDEDAGDDIPSVLGLAAGRPRRDRKPSVKAKAAMGLRICGNYMHTLGSVGIYSKSLDSSLIFHGLRDFTAHGWMVHSMAVNTPYPFRMYPFYIE